MRAILVTVFCWSLVGQLSAEPKVEVLLDGLNEPLHVSLRPIKKNPYELAVCESGSGRVVLCVTDQPHKSVVLLQDLPRRKIAGSERELGPLATAWLDQYSLCAVGPGTKEEPTRTVNVWKLKTADNTPQDINQASTFAGGPIDVDAAEAADYSVISADYMFDALHIWYHKQETLLQRAYGNSTKLNPLKPFGDGIKTGRFTEFRALAISPRGEVFIACEPIKNEVNGRLLILHFTSGRVLLDQPLPLSGVRGLVYNKPVNAPARLLAVAQTEKVDQTGLYRLDAGWSEGRAIVTPKFLLKLDQPTALTAVDSGAVYVTVLGQHNGEGKPGQLLSITELD